MTYNPNLAGGAYQYDPNWPTYRFQNGKTTAYGQETPFGYTGVSTHEAGIPISEVEKAFGPLITTIKAVDIDLANTINRVDATLGEAGQTMAYYNSKLVGGGMGPATHQTLSAVDTSMMVGDRYQWIFDRLGESETQVGVALNAWFDVLNTKFLEASRDNTAKILGIVVSLSQNIDSFMQLPLSLTQLIGDSVKSVRQGGSPESVATEIMGVVGAYATAKEGLDQLGLQFDGSRVAAYLANVNAIGYGIADASSNLIAYASVLKRINGDIAGLGDQLLTTVENKFQSLKSQGYDNAQLNAYIGSFGLFARLFNETGVAFNEANLDNVAAQLHSLSVESVQTAKNTIDQAIADANLSAKSRDAAIAILLKTQKIDEATVAESEYGVSIQKNSQTMVSQFGFIQQIGYLAGKTLGELKITADTLIPALNNVVNVFGDMQAAATTLDSIAKAYMTPIDYAQYNLDTVNRAIANSAKSSPALQGLTNEVLANVINSGETITSFIDGLAKGNGELAKTTVEYIKLLMQQKDAEAAVADAASNQTKQLQDLLQSLYRSSTQAADLADQLLTKYGEMFSKAVALGANLGQQMQIVDAGLNEAVDSIGAAMRNLSATWRSAVNARSSIAGNIQTLGGSTAASRVGYQQQIIDQLYDQLAEAANNADKVGIINELNTAVMDRYNAELDMLGKVSDSVKQIRGYVDNLKLSDKSPLTNREKLQEARSQFATQLAAANAGDNEALAGITQSADAYLSKARTYYASGQDYSAIFGNVMAALDQLAAPVGLDEASYKQATLNLQHEAIAELTGLDSTLQQISLDEQAGYDTRHGQLLNSLDRVKQAVTEASNTLQAPLYDFIAWAEQGLARPLQSAESNWVQQQFYSGATAGDIQPQASQYIVETNITTAINDAMTALGRNLSDVEQQWITDQFNAGRSKNDIYADAARYIDGSHAGGLDYVPFDGYRAELHQGERVLTAYQARSQDNNMAQMAAELRALRAELAQLRAEQRSQTEAVIRANYDANERAAEAVGARVEKSADKQRWQSHKVAPA